MPGTLMSAVRESVTVRRFRDLTGDLSDWTYPVALRSQHAEEPLCIAGAGQVPNNPRGPSDHRSCRESLGALIAARVGLRHRAVLGMLGDVVHGARAVSHACVATSQVVIV
jgi:hypothetical protein